MLALTQIPRGSNKKGETGNLKKVTAFLKETAEELGCETYVDKGENLIIRKKATPGILFAEYSVYI
jgi:putative aminopeptidase FrvX